MTKILVVDDSLMEQSLTRSLLTRRSQYDVTLAENGKTALEQLAQEPCDLVITDLVMPELDGAELTREVRRRFPDIPVILMTAYGNESTALDALEAGAASYVPKSRRAEQLLATAERVLERAVINRARGRLSQCMLEYHGRFALDNDLPLIRLLVEQSQQLMAGIGAGDAVWRIRVGEALEEALINAMLHGNLELGEKELEKCRSDRGESTMEHWISERCRDPQLGERKIIVVMHLTKEEVRFVVRDQGRGFSTNFASSQSMESFGKGNHRGLTLIHSLMDTVRFNEAGNEITMCKHAR